MMGIFDIEKWNEVWQTIHRNKKRSIMTAFGVFWGVFMLVVLLGFGIGFGKFLRSSLGDMSSNTCFLFNNTTSVPYKGMGVNRWWNMNTDDMKSLREVKNVKYVAPMYWSREVTVSFENQKGSYDIVGKDPEIQKVDPKKILKGRFISEIDEANLRKVCVIGKEVLDGLFHGADPIGKKLQVNGSYYTVVGVVESKTSSVGFENTPRTVSIPGKLFRQMFGLGDIVNAMSITAYDDANIEEVQAECCRVLAANHLISPDDKKAINAFNLGEMYGKMNELFNGVLILTWIVGVGTLLAGIVGVSNIMLVVVRERTQEIGVRRALGAKPSVIISQILSESFVLTFVAGIFGLAAAVGVLSIADMILAKSMSQNMSHGSVREASFQITFWMGILCAAIVAAGSLIAGIIPANRAMTIKAVDALRDE